MRRMPSSLRISGHQLGNLWRPTAKKTERAVPVPRYPVAQDKSPADLGIDVGMEVDFHAELIQHKVQFYVPGSFSAGIHNPNMRKDFAVVEWRRTWSNGAQEVGATEEVQGARLMMYGSRSTRTKDQTAADIGMKDEDYVALYHVSIEILAIAVHLVYYQASHRTDYGYAILRRRIFHWGLMTRWCEQNSLDGRALPVQRQRRCDDQTRSRDAASR